MDILVINRDSAIQETYEDLPFPLPEEFITVLFPKTGGITLLTTLTNNKLFESHVTCLAIEKKKWKPNWGSNRFNCKSRKLYIDDFLTFVPRFSYGFVSFCAIDWTYDIHLRGKCV